MFKKIASAPKKVATHVHARRARYAAVTGIIAGGYIVHQFDDRVLAVPMAFIEEQGLSDEFFNFAQ